MLCCSWAKLTLRVLQRQIVLTRRDRAYAVARIVQILVVALIIGSLFSGVEVTQQDGRTVRHFAHLCQIVFGAQTLGPTLLDPLPQCRSYHSWPSQRWCCQ